MNSEHLNLLNTLVAKGLNSWIAYVKKEEKKQ